MWAHGVTAGGLRLRARYGRADAEETTEFQYQRANGAWKEVRPSYQNGYARLRFQVAGVEHEERRNRVFCYLVHGPPPGDPAEYHADHTAKVESNGRTAERWARSTGPVQWLEQAEHGRKHGQEGAEEARKRRQDVQRQHATKARRTDDA